LIPREGGERILRNLQTAVQKTDSKFRRIRAVNAADPSRMLSVS